MWMPLTYQQICFLFNGIFILGICVCPLLSETHWVLSGRDEVSGGKVVSVTGSPLCLKQSHSLVDFLEQHKIVDALRKLQTQLQRHGEVIYSWISFFHICRPFQKAFFANRKENQQSMLFRSADPDCLATKHLKFFKETFSDFLDFDLMPYFTNSKKYPNPPLAKDVVTTDNLRKMYFGTLKSKKNGEPICHRIFVSDSEETVIKIADTLSSEYQKEENLLNLSEEELINLGDLLSAGLEDENLKFYAFYYSAFYWRYLGNHREAATCLQKHLIMGISTAGIYQIGCIHARTKDYYHAIAAFRTTEETLSNGFSAQWFTAGGDVHVLAQIYRAAESYYKRALALASEAEKTKINLKLKLVRCENAVTALSNNPRTKDDFEELRKSMTEWETKQTSMFERALPIDKWLKGKYAYQFLVDGPIPGLSCKGSTNKKGRHLLQCDIESPKLYNESIFLKRWEKRKESVKNIDDLVAEINKASEQRAEYLNYMLESHVATHAYISKLQPFLSVNFDEPQNSRIYPKQTNTRTDASFSFQGTNRGNCQGLESLNVDQLYDPTKNDADLIFSFPYFPELFISPDNKGFSTNYVLTTLVALLPSEISPLPWSEPRCANHLKKPLDSESELFFGLTLADFSKTKPLKYQEKSLKLYLSGILGSGSNAVIGDVGQRIATLLKYGIGPHWISGNLAAVYWRFLGNMKEAALCLKLALDDGKYPDLTLVQIGQLILRLDKEFIPLAKKVVQKAVEEDKNEPVSHFVLGFLHYLSGSFYSAKTEFLDALELEPDFDEARTMLKSISCFRRSNSWSSIRTRNQPLCCWPGEQNVYCFEEDARRGLQHCFKIAIKDEAKLTVKFQYVRCNGKYVKQSFKNHPIYDLLSPYFISKSEIENILLQKKFSKVSTNLDEDKEVPIFALDYGGFDDARFKAYSDQQVNLDDFEQSMIDFGTIREERLRREKQSAELRKAKLNDTEFEQKVELLKTLTERKQVMALDVGLPSYLPEPSQELIRKGLVYLKPPKENTLADYCVMIEKNKRVLDHPSPTYVSVTAKGVRLEDYVDLTAPVTTITKDEPVCPEVELNPEWQELDDLPAFRFREHFGFYKPEVGLTETLMSLGHKNERVDHVAARLFFAMKTSKLNLKHSQGQDEGVNGIITAVSTLYWRVKGDAVNALKCLRHALKNLSRDKKDTALISMANIYHQAGFLHSALIVGGKAHQMTPDLVVIHFTLANIYATMGDHSRALKFYYSTLALQPSFQIAKERIRAIYCLTHGKVKI
uniref:Tetratricopeptide repeat protein 17 n=1 Tax=Panagrolaimus sp. JU765 TaxID=591449 RepID=A0AC34RLP9_9BILA